MLQSIFISLIYFSPCCLAVFSVPVAAIDGQLQTTLLVIHTSE